jgi:hypothetical protein
MPKIHDGAAAIAPSPRHRHTAPARASPASPSPLTRRRAPSAYNKPPAPNTITSEPATVSDTPIW